MKLIHFESGLGNQMLNYAEYLAMQISNPEDQCIIENIIYEIPEVNKTICQWNGYELDRIFNLQLPNIKNYMTKKDWNEVINDVRASQFWNHEWNYPEAILGALGRKGFKFQNECIVRYAREKTGIRKILFKLLNENEFSGNLRLWIKQINDKKYKYSKSHPERLFIKSPENIYTGQTGMFMFNGNNIEIIEEKIHKSFKFPQFTSSQNIELAKKLQKCNSVSIHARRGDALSSTGFYYNSGYFKRAVRYIKKNVKTPEFYFFSDPGSIHWCKNNLEIFGLNYRDTVNYVDWNTGLESFRDMQLMSLCKHNIVTYSSFGWWSTFLNQNPDKITCSPIYSMKTTNHF